MGHTATPAGGVVAIGASAGGIEALTELAAGMTANFPFAVMIVIHMSRATPSLLAQIIDRSGPVTGDRGGRRCSLGGRTHLHLGA